MSKFTPWTDEEAEKWASDEAQKAYDSTPGFPSEKEWVSICVHRAVIGAFAKSAAQIEKCETIYYRDSDHEERVIVASPEYFELDTHEAKLVGVREVEK